MKSYIITQLGRFGDLILVTPCFEAIKKWDPNAKTIAIAGRHNYQVLLGNPFIDKIFIFEKRPLKLLEFMSKIRFRNYDYYIDVKDHYSTESKMIANFVNAKVKIGYSCKGEKKVFNIGFTDDKPPEIKHFTAIALYALSMTGIHIENYLVKPSIFEQADSKQYAAGFLKVHHINSYSLINISASHERKMWGIESWNKFIKNAALKEKNVVITYAPPEMAKAKKLLELNNKLALFNTRNFNDVISICAGASEIITPDTSIVHIASAFEKPLLALYSGLDDFYEKFHPTGRKYVVVRASKGFDGIKDIQVASVVNAYHRLHKLCCHY